MGLQLTQHFTLLTLGLPKESRVFSFFQIFKKILQIIKPINKSSKSRAIYLQTNTQTEKEIDKVQKLINSAAYT